MFTLLQFAEQCLFLRRSLVLVTRNFLNFTLLITTVKDFGTGWGKVSTYELMIAQVSIVEVHLTEARIMVSVWVSLRLCSTNLLAVCVANVA